ncbi:endonuclease domain-containing protein [Caldimonas sp. KR1-144]|uniref:endonuclease domain-containing protein n=1 Tax=Caldimonas sp. KR1-144 TaxID=3400911 RepID=UPI003BFF4B07
MRAARGLRQRSTDAEAMLWNRLRSRQLDGLKFRRQHPVAGFVVDFACMEAGIAVELDGGHHAEPAAVLRDDQRSQAIADEGLRVIRFWNNDVLNNIEGVLQIIAEATRHPHPSPLPQAGEGAKHPALSPAIGEGVNTKEPSHG